jgi:hypothetical protein
LAEGKVLYRDVWYPYNPGAPYLNAILFLIFGTHINVAYLAGAHTALAVALTLFRCALYVSSAPVAFAVGYVVLIQSFGPGIFNYPLPYSYAAAYGSLAACVFLLYAIRAAIAPTNSNLFWAALWSAMALLMKLEYGFACFTTLAMLHLGLLLRQRSGRAALKNFLLTLPSLLLCAAVTVWMVSIGGLNFITQENFTSWPSSYFMRAYGQFWLGGQGFELSWRKLIGALGATVAFVICWTAFRFWLASWLRRPSVRTIGLAMIASASAVTFGLARPKQINDAFALLIFPPPMVFIVALSLPVMLFLFYRRCWQPQPLVILLIFAFAVLLGFRILFGMVPHAYAIFYNGPVLLAFAWLLFSIAIPNNVGHNRPRATKVILCICAAFCIWVTLQVYPSYREMRKQRTALQSERGMIYVHDWMLPAWAEAVDFMRQAKTTGAAVMSVPEDTALYFFSSTLCPVRVCIFHPGIVEPGAMMDRVIDQIARTRVRYIIWSNRKFYEYNAPDFGLDYDAPLGEYIRSNYRPVRNFGFTERPDTWHATLWEKKEGSANRTQ